MALRKVICWAPIFIIRIPFPPGKSQVTNCSQYFVCKLSNESLSFNLGFLLKLRILQLTPFLLYLTNLVKPQLFKFLVLFPDGQTECFEFGHER